LRAHEGALYINPVASSKDPQEFDFTNIKDQTIM
jgi:hypothetical protein